MKGAIIILLILFTSFQSSLSQGYIPKIESCPCMIKVDPKLLSKCGYLVVPENRQKPNGRTIKVPFVYLRKLGSDSIKNVVLLTTGGPGYSTIANFDSIPYTSGYFQYGGFIAFDQRGTKKSEPCLDCPEIDLAIRRAYKENRSKDSLVLAAVKQCRKRLVDQGIDLSAYNTIESAADINDLRQVLKIDSLTLAGISYSGGLMLTVARNHPQRIKALILNSPLPGYVNYEEHGLLNMNEALNQVFDNCERDSIYKPIYANLRERFHQYFTSITGKSFTLAFVEKGASKTITIRYTKNELLDAVIERLTTDQLKTVPFVINEIIKGNHGAYVKEVLDEIFKGDKNLSYGMRYSVYCSEQIAYADRVLIKKQDAILPWFSGYPFNNVDHAICDCWKVRREPAVAKTPVYSNIPTLISDGDADPWCRPFYNQLIKRYMPNSQILLIHNRAHGAGFGVDGVDFMKMFMGNPYKKIISPIKEVVVQ